MIHRIVVAAALATGAGRATAPTTSAPAARAVASDVTEPEIISEYLVPYPEDASRSQASGTVVLKVTLDETGQVTDVKVVERQGYGMDEAAASALRKFRFKPASLHGKPVPFIFVYRYSFVR